MCVCLIYVRQSCTAVVIDANIQLLFEPVCFDHICTSVCMSSVRDTSITNNTVQNATIFAETGSEVVVIDNVFSGNTDGDGLPLDPMDRVFTFDVPSVIIE